LGGPVRLQLLLAGLGGEGEERMCAAATTLQRRRSRFLERATSAAVSKRRLAPAVAIFGHRVGSTALELGSSSLLHRWRNFSDYGVAMNVASSPSGFVPGEGSGGRAGKSATVGDGFGLDRVFAHLCGVLVAKYRDSVVIFLFLEILYVTVLPRTI
jgi:hypothetical protein